MCQDPVCAYSMLKHAGISCILPALHPWWRNLLCYCVSSSRYIMHRMHMSRCQQSEWEICTFFPKMICIVVYTNNSCLFPLLPPSALISANIKAQCVTFQKDLLALNWVNKKMHMYVFSLLRKILYLIFLIPLLHSPLFHRCAAAVSRWSAVPSAGFFHLIAHCPSLVISLSSSRFPF